jgi:hypothetical protein
VVKPHTLWPKILGGRKKEFLHSLLRPPFSCQKQPCGPEGRVLRVKSIGGERNPLEGQPMFPQNKAGAFALESPSSWGKEKLAPLPEKEIMPCGFCVQRAFFRAWQYPTFNQFYAYLAGSKGGQG